MRITQILPGSGGTFYCENCMRDSALARRLIQYGHDVTIMPMYLPIYSDEPTLAEGTPIFFGGINAYLQQKIPIFRHTPRWLDRLFDAHWVLQLAAKRAGSTRASALGDMTFSMLQGSEGHQAKEVERMLAWLEAQPAPDIIHVSSVLLLGLAPEIKRRLKCPLVYTSMDEDTWLKELPQPWQKRCWEIMRKQVSTVDAVVCPSQHYADRIAARLNIPLSLQHVIPIGIDTTGYEREHPPAVPTLGYLSRMSQKLGLGTLIEAFIRLKNDEPKLKDLRLRIMGGQTGDDYVFVRKLRRKLTRAGLKDAVDFLPEVDRESRLHFLKSLSILSVPMPEGEAFGTFIIEALATGVPVVQPDAGGFSEVVRDTGGGCLIPPDDLEALITSLHDLLLNQPHAASLGAIGRQRVLEHYSIEAMAQRTLNLYRMLQTKHESSSP
ncbi:MAG: glycosyltransferase family 4 protein [Kiritimatiellae bacterium]|nr:glycosyltransferase family 4 protein [Kiritimatiellia bacterium]